MEDKRQRCELNFRNSRPGWCATRCGNHHQKFLHILGNWSPRAPLRHGIKMLTTLLMDVWHFAHNTYDIIIILIIKPLAAIGGRVAIATMHLNTRARKSVCRVGTVRVILNNSSRYSRKLNWNFSVRPYSVGI